MKKIAAIALGLCLVGIVAVKAEDKKEKTKPTAEQKQVLKDIKEKYDANKDGKLDKEEKAKISAEDKAKLEKAGLGQHHKKKGGKKSDK